MKDVFGERIYLYLAKFVGMDLDNLGGEQNSISILFEKKENYVT